MSVVIKGMKMPESCPFCCCFNEECDSCNADDEFRFTPTSGRPDWCPLEEVNDD